MNASTFENVIWFSNNNNKNQKLPQEFIKQTLEQTSSKSSTSSTKQVVGQQWSSWLNQIEQLFPSTSPSSSSIQISPKEILAEGGANKSLLIQKCTTTDSNNNNVNIVAKYISLGFWKKIIQQNQNQNKMMPLSFSSALIGKDAMNLEKSFIREALNNLWICSQQQDAEEECENKNICRLLGIGWAVVREEKDDFDDSSSSDSDAEEKNQNVTNNKTPCLFFEYLDFTFPEFLKRIVTSVKNLQQDDDDGATLEKKSVLLFKFLKQKLLTDVRDNVLMKKLVPNKDNENCYYLSAHLDICPHNILVRIDNKDQEDQEENEIDFNFVLADWDCAVWSTAKTRSDDDKNNQNNGDVDHLVDSIVTKYGTPPFADERIIAVQDEIIDLNEAAKEKEDKEEETNVAKLSTSSFQEFIFKRNDKKTSYYTMTTKFIKSCDIYSLEHVLLGNWLEGKISSNFMNNSSFVVKKSSSVVGGSVEDIFCDNEENFCNNDEEEDHYQRVAMVDDENSQKVIQKIVERIFLRE